MEHPIEFINVSKKFRKGDKVFALRDAIPSMTMNLIKSGRPAGQDGLRSDEFWAVKDVSFHVKKGEVLGIIGANGAGKSTILKMLSRIYTPDDGDIKIRGRLSALIEVTAGFHPEFTGRENIYFNGTILGMTKKEIDAKYESIVEFSGVREFIDTPVKRYSSGMSARLGFAVAAHVEPDILLVDEVLSVGDMTFQTKCTEKMRELINSGTTIIFISHNIPLVQSLCERIILLDRGRVLKEGYPEEVVPTYEEIVFKGREDAIKKRLEGTTEERILNQNKGLIRMKDIRFLGDNGTEIQSIEIGDNLTLDVEYESAIDNDEYVFAYEIVRSDGTVSCTSNTKKDKVRIPVKKGLNRLKIAMKDVKIVPGVFFIKVSIWDKDMAQSYTVKRKGVFSIQIDRSIGQSMGAACLQEPEWIVEIL